MARYSPGPFTAGDLIDRFGGQLLHEVPREHRIGQQGAYLPFSMGQRKCIGDTFAMVEAQLILVTVLRRFHLELVPGQTFEPEPVITLRPRGGVHVIPTARVL